MSVHINDKIKIQDLTTLKAVTTQTPNSSYAGKLIAGHRRFHGKSATAPAINGRHFCHHRHGESFYDDREIRRIQKPREKITRVTRGRKTCYAGGLTLRWALKTAGGKSLTKE